MSSHRELLDWSDLYGERAAQPRTTPTPTPTATVVERRASGVNETKPYRVIAPLTAFDTTADGEPFNESRGSRGALQRRRSSTPRAIAGKADPDPPRPITPRKIEQLAMPHDRYGLPMEAPAPNYGTLLSFSEEERRDAERRDRLLNVPRKPQKLVRTHTVPVCDPVLERLARPKRYKDPQDSNHLSDSYNRCSPHSAAADSAITFDRLSQPKKPTPSPYTSANNSNTHNPRLRSASAKVRSDQAMSFLARPKHRNAPVEGVNKSVEASRSHSKSVYGGTTVVDYSPLQPAHGKSLHLRGRASTDPVWTNIQRPRAALKAIRGPDEYRHMPTCKHHQQRAHARTRSPAVRVVRSEPAQARARSVPPIQEMPKPPTEVKTKRFQATDDAPLWPPQAEKRMQTPGPPTAVIAVRRTSGSPAINGEEEKPSEPVPVVVAVRRAKQHPIPAGSEAKERPGQPLDTTGAAALGNHKKNRQHPSNGSAPSLASTSNALGQRVAVSSPTNNIRKTVYKPPPTRTENTGLRMGSASK